MTFAAVAAVLGWIGTFLLLLGYWAVSTRRWPGESLPFQAANVVGSIGLGLAAVAGKVWSAATLNAIWAAIGITTLIRLARRRGRPHPASDQPEQPDQSGDPDPAR